MSFLSIPSQEGLFTTIKIDKSAVNAERNCMDDDDDDDEDDDSENVRLIPRCSPVPRKRGLSIYDETAEYLRIQSALSVRKKVQFADTTGGDLVDVKEFVAFDSDSEEESARWEEEEAKYRKPEREPTYHVHPEFSAPSGGSLLQVVHASKVEVEQISPAEDEPLALRVLIRVLNVSFHKAVYIRSTMDSWASYFDHPAEYVQGSNDGNTDQFSFKLSFSPPYITHGSRIEFVVRYETSDGDYWANNSHMNYVVTLLLSYEDELAQKHTDMQQSRGILKPPKAYSMEDPFDSEEEQDKDEAEEAGSSRSALNRPPPLCPVIIQPEIDIEIAVHPSAPGVPPTQVLPSADGSLSALTVSPGELFPCMSSESTLQTNSSFVLHPNKSQPLPRLHCELEVGNQASEQPIDGGPCALLPDSNPSAKQESSQRSHSSQASSPSEASCEEMNPWEAPGEDESTDSTVDRPCLELPPECVSAPSATQQEVAVGMSELSAGGYTRSAEHHEGSSTDIVSLEAESDESLREADGEDPPSPELSEAFQSTWEETEDAPETPPDALLENPPNTEVPKLHTGRDANINLMPSVVFLSGVVSLSIVLQEPTALFIIGLLLVLHQF
ncbi:uncharacterized protein [Pseudochaenichthys georgianus]|uniref:uncharacterized protein isoform X1 n=1 Tax=Pseudochaenichthys georgianus TaxID=52239 RepID=UPI00146D9F64|nr:uncharacterized protein si:ch211-167b20.8 isoform X1 [Pseudochaenichthys georgianus]